MFKLLYFSSNIFVPLLFISATDKLSFRAATAFLTFCRRTLQKHPHSNKQSFAMTTNKWKLIQTFKVSF